MFNSKFALSIFLSSLFTLLALAAPVDISILDRASSVADARQFSQFTIANGVGGNALAEAQAAFPGTAADLSAAQTAGFNADANCAVRAESAFLSDGAIASASRATNSISVGLFKNKVLKIYGTLLVLQAEVAQNGGVASASQQAAITDQMTKLAENVQVDQTNAGLASTSASFTC